MNADTLLARLEKVKASGQDRWIARCPAHQDQGPSLTVRELADGRVLLHCFAGCATSDVLAAIGLEFADLFPELLPTLPPERQRERREGFTASDILQALTYEITCVAIAAGTLQRCGWLNDEECDRLHLAYERITGAVAYVERLRHG